MVGTAVRCSNVVKEYPQGRATVRALRGIDLEVRLGELLLLMGPSGCGKTTLLSVIAGVLDATSGETEVLDVPLHQLSRPDKTAFRLTNIGFVFQSHNLLPALSAAENAAIPLLLGRRRRSVAVAAAGDLLTRLGMGERADALPANLSGGEQQRVAIARALVHQPRLVVCDEPTSALDARTGKTIMQQLRAIAVQPDRSVIVVTHDPRVLEFADRIATMEDGRIVDVRENRA